MANGDEEEEKSGDQQQQRSNKNKTQIVIGVPSYQEVLYSSQTKSTPPSLFKPSQTFSQAFAFVKSSEFYSPPPPPSAATASSSGAKLPGSSQMPSLNQTAQADVVSSSSSSSSSSASAPASSAGAGALPSNSTQTRNAILVSNRQKGNPLLKHIRNVRWAFSDIIPDYLLGQSSCALYLSLRYHLLHPDYLYYRIRELQKNYKLRVVLCHVDVEDVVKPLLEVTKTALLHDCTLLCGWSLAECARYLETIKVYENKPADLIQGQMDTDYLSRLNHTLTAVRHVNKTDVITLGSTFGSLSHIIDASMEDLARCPGIGERKVKRLYDTFHEPFKRATSGHPSVSEASNPETSAKEGKILEETARDDDFTEDSSKRQKKEPEKTIKSALSAVFARYSDKLSKKNERSNGQNEGAKKMDKSSDSENPNAT